MRKPPNLWKRSPFLIVGTAFHEAGHVVAALILGVRVVRVSIYPSGQAVGICTFVPPDCYFYPSPWQEADMAQRCIIMSYAGLLAHRIVDPACSENRGLMDEILIHGFAQTHCGFHDPKTRSVMGYDEFLEGLRYRAECLVLAHRAGISLLAAEILRKKKMLNDEIELWARRHRLPAIKPPPVDLSAVSADYRRMLGNRS